MSAVDDAIRETVADDHPEAVVIGWVTTVEYVLPSGDSHSTVIRCWSAEGQSAAHTIGMHALAGDYYRGLLSGSPDE